MSWFIWAVILIAQNFAFTFVSRARNSGSLRRHVVASVASNGIWFTSQFIIFSKMYDLMTGKHGVVVAIATGLFYTGFTVLGALIGHHISLKTEKGKGAVGASKKYAQIPVEEWERIKTVTEYGVAFDNAVYKFLLDNPNSLMNAIRMAGARTQTYIIPPTYPVSIPALERS
jgi:hypothetical protein